jgi:hypothetical protein
MYAAATPRMQAMAVDTAEEYRLNKRADFTILDTAAAARAFREIFKVRDKNGVKMRKRAAATGIIMIKLKILSPGFFQISFTQTFDFSRSG